MGRDPGVPLATTVHVTPEGAVSGQKQRARSALTSRGWNVRWHPEPPERADVRLRLVESMPPRVRWPLAVSAAALETPELLDLIAKRDTVQRRRLLLRGLEHMLKRARRRSYAKGTGFWIAPQHWFAVGLTRDTDDDSDEDTTHLSMIGEPYHVVIPHAARQHAYEVFRGVEIDIMFVEDGVSWRGVRRVLFRVFEHFDAGRGRIEERHLHGFTKIRVIVHDFRIGEPLGREKYPEPDYDDLGRARVLHVFKDRGGEDEIEPAPSVDEGVPVRA